MMVGMAKDHKEQITVDTLRRIRNEHGGEIIIKPWESDKDRVAIVRMSGSEEGPTIVGSPSEMRALAAQLNAFLDDFGGEY